MMSALGSASSSDRPAWRSRLAITTKLKKVLKTLLRLYPTFFRLTGIFFGIYLMGAHAFFSFYLLHMFLKAVLALFHVDSDIIVMRRVRRNSTINRRCFLYVLSLNFVAALMALATYWSAVALFDQFIAPKTIDMDFAGFYALTIISTVLTPLAGLIKSKGSAGAKALLLRGDNLMTLFCITAFFVAGVDHALLPYAWLSASLIMSSLTALAGLFYWTRLRDTPPRNSRGGEWTTQAIRREIFAFSMSRTNGRATFLLAKGVISALLGPFAGLALKAARFTDDSRRQRYFTKLKKRRLFKQVDGRIPVAVKRGVTRARTLWIALVVAVSIMAAMVALHDTLDGLVMLGLLVLTAKIISIAVRFLILSRLAPEPKPDAPPLSCGRSHGEPGSKLVSPG